MARDRSRHVARANLPARVDHVKPLGIAIGKGWSRLAARSRKMSENCRQNPDVALSAIRTQISDMSLPDQITERILQRGLGSVWTPVDFLDLGSRAAVDKAL